MKALDVFIVGTLILLLLLQRVMPARAHVSLRAWPWRGLALFGLTGTLSAAVPLLIDEEWLRANRLLNGSDLGIPLGVVVGWLTATFASYWWHRLEHKVPWIWRVFHQFHHSPQRMDVFVGFYFHPLDFLVYRSIGLLVLVLLLGLDPLAVAIVGAMGAVGVMVTHSNLRTPVWLGLIQQRPEAHLLHHQRGVHCGNYSDFPLWDRIFGTYRHPDGVYQGHVGFDHGEDIIPMMLGIDVNSPTYKPGLAPAEAPMQAEESEQVRHH